MLKSENTADCLGDAVNNSATSDFHAVPAHLHVRKTPPTATVCLPRSSGQWASLCRISRSTSPTDSYACSTRFPPGSHNSDPTDRQHLKMSVKTVSGFFWFVLFSFVFKTFQFSFLCIRVRRICPPDLADESHFNKEEEAASCHNLSGFCGGL